MVSKCTRMFSCDVKHLSFRCQTLKFSHPLSDGMEPRDNCLAMHSCSSSSSGVFYDKQKLPFHLIRNISSFLVGVALGQILFVLPKIGSKLELSLMQLLRSKFGKISQWTKKIKDTVVYGWGMKIFPKSPKENNNSFLKMSTACLLRKIDAQ